jgi:hypothetical protein
MSVLTYMPVILHIVNYLIGVVDFVTDIIMLNYRMLYLS